MTLKCKLGGMTRFEFQAFKMRFTKDEELDVGLGRNFLRSQA